MSEHGFTVYPNIPRRRGLELAQWATGVGRCGDVAEHLRIDGSYVTIHGGQVARTVQIFYDLNVDLTTDGRVVGVERIGAAVTVQDLASVLLRLPFPPSNEGDRT